MERLKVGDLVVVISGEDKGKTGKVSRVLPDQGKVVVEGVNVVRKHVRSMPERPGGIVEMEAPVFASKVMPVDPETKKPTRVKVQVKDGQKVRVAKSGAVLTGQE